MLRHIPACVFPYFKVPPSWSKHMLLPTTRRRRSSSFSTKRSGSIMSTRRSGHRGTASLNFWINIVCWISSVAQDPAKLLNPRCTEFTEVTGKRSSKATIRSVEGCHLSRKEMSSTPCSLAFYMKFKRWEEIGELRGTRCICKEGDLNGAPTRSDACEIGGSVAPGESSKLSSKLSRLAKRGH